MPARARMMPISHGTACSAVVGRRRLPSRFGSQDSGEPSKARRGGRGLHRDLVAGLALGLELGFRNRLRLGNRFWLRLRFVEGRGRSQLIRDCLSGDGGRGSPSVRSGSGSGTDSVSGSSSSTGGVGAS